MYGFPVPRAFSAAPTFMTAPDPSTLPEPKFNFNKPAATTKTATKTGLPALARVKQPPVIEQFTYTTELQVLQTRSKRKVSETSARVPELFSKPGTHTFPAPVSTISPPSPCHLTTGIRPKLKLLSRSAPITAPTVSIAPFSKQGTFFALTTTEKLAQMRRGLREGCRVVVRALCASPGLIEFIGR